MIIVTKRLLVEAFARLLIDSTDKVSMILIVSDDTILLGDERNDHYKQLASDEAIHATLTSYVKEPSLQTSPKSTEPWPPIKRRVPVKIAPHKAKFPKERLTPGNFNCSLRTNGKDRT